ncbi:ubiquitin carrier protein 1 [Striga asiatica]|uniref:Ubiquitin carrier protein 1 n=1 Tax=Striga asiatica TaxID=4170 RepID=A0A5A7QGV3_STRAF|nr:ubiquitin carrier protein 1 [Striga asiatica]
MAVPGPRLSATLTEGRPPYDAAYHHHSAARLKLRPAPHFRNSDRTSPAPPSAHPSSFKISTAFSQPHLRPSPSIRRISRTFAIQRFSSTSVRSKVRSPPPPVQTATIDGVQPLFITRPIMPSRRQPLLCRGRPLNSRSSLAAEVRQRDEGAAVAAVGLEPRTWVADVGAGIW